MLKIKNLVFISLVFLMLISNIAMAADKPPEITAKSAIIMDAMTGKILYEKNSEERRYPASTTKMMTLIVALEHGKVDDIVTTSANAASTEGSSLWLSQGEQLKLLDMLYGIMLVSGNDATVAVAEHISGSVENFARLMTEKAHAIGAINTNFTNTSGLPDPNHYSTAHDLARIAAYGYKKSLFSEIVSTKNRTMPWAGKDHDRALFNENKILWLYDGGNGVKTGYTEIAGRCLVSGAKRNDIQLVAVVLDSDHMWDDSMALLDYGFKHLKPMRLLNGGDILKTIRVNNGKTDTVRLITSDGLVVPVSEEDEGDFRTVIEAPGKIEAPVVTGQKIGVIRAFYKNTEIATIDLVADDNVDRKSLFGLLWGSVWNFFTFFIRNFA